MEYREFKILCLEEYREILIAELSEIGFDAFLETEEGFECYFPTDSFSSAPFQAIIDRYRIPAHLCYQESTTQKVNWNEEWEKNYDPIEVEDLVYVRASFHPSRADFRHEIVINPKMSFGTGHHATTYQMLKLQHQIDHRDKRILDIGSGTGILAIMGFLLGASSIEAFDIDDWCVENGNENFQLNKVPATMQLGTIRAVKPKGSFDILLANINKNILLDELPLYAPLLKSGGYLLMSGFYEEDSQELIQKCSTLNLSVVQESSRNTWVALWMKKN